MNDETTNNSLIGKRIHYFDVEAKIVGQNDNGSLKLEYKRGKHTYIRIFNPANLKLFPEHYYLIDEDEKS